MWSKGFWGGMDLPQVPTGVFSFHLHGPQSLGSPLQPFPEESSQAQKAHLGLFPFIASILLGFTGFKTKPNTPLAASWLPGLGPCWLDPPSSAPKTS